MSSVSQYVPLVRTELEKLARAGRVTYYKDLGAVIGKPPRWTLWKAVLDEISYKKPDVTIIVLQAASGANRLQRNKRQTNTRSKKICSGRADEGL
jgi:hypothetical protein